MYISGNNTKPNDKLRIHSKLYKVGLLKNPVVKVTKVYVSFFKCHISTLHFKSVRLVH